MDSMLIVIKIKKGAIFYEGKTRFTRNDAKRF